MTTYGPSESSVISMEVEAMVNYLSFDVNPKTAEEGDVQLTLSGRLYNSLGGVANATIDLYLYYSQYSRWVKFGTATTDSSGYFSDLWTFSNLAAGNRQFKAVYAVDGTESSVVTVAVAGQVETTLTAVLADPSIYVGEPFTINGYLKDVSGNPVSGKKIYINVVTHPTGVSGDIGSVTTNSSGYYSFTSSWAMETADIGDWVLKAVFKGD